MVFTNEKLKEYSLGLRSVGGEILDRDEVTEGGGSGNLCHLPVVGMGSGSEYS